MSSYSEINLNTIKHIKRDGEKYFIFTVAEMVYSVTKSTPVYSYRAASGKTKAVTGKRNSFESLQTKRVEETIEVSKAYAKKLHQLMSNSGIEFLQQNIEQGVWVLSVM